MDVKLLAIWLSDNGCREFGVLLCVVGPRANGILGDPLKKESDHDAGLLYSFGNSCFALNTMVIGLLMNHSI